MYMLMEIYVCTLYIQVYHAIHIEKGNLRLNCNGEPSRTMVWFDFGFQVAISTMFNLQNKQMCMYPTAMQCDEQPLRIDTTELH